jgi:hypothetical protein
MEIDELEKMHARGAPKRSTRDLLRKALLVARMRCAEWLWVPNLIVVAVLMYYLGAVFGMAFLDWILVGGVQ